MKILIVDDHQPMREMIKAILGDLAGQSVEAGDGEESVRQYRAHRPDVVLMDLLMPGMGGIEATRMIKAEFPQARVVIVTQQDQMPLRRAAAAAGACAYILKENLQQIRDCIQ